MHCFVVTMLFLDFLIDLNSSLLDSGKIGLFDADLDL